MTKLVLPHTIDAGTDIVAVEHQDNYVAIRDTVNGTLQGGDPAVNGNMAANGITYRELAHNLMKYHTLGPIRQEGIWTEGQLKVSPSSGLILAVAAGEAMIKDDTGIVFDVGMLVPVKYAGGTVTLDTAHATLPRVDQIVARVTDYEAVTIEKLTGTATAGAQIALPSSANYRAGAAALGNDRILLADVIVVAADTVIVAADINDRRPWCRGEMEFTVSGVSSFDFFSDLNGDADYEYELGMVGPWVLPSSGNLRVRPHNITSTTYHQTWHYVTNGAAHTNGDVGSITGYDLTTAFGAETHSMRVKFTLSSRTGPAGAGFGRPGRGEMFFAQKVTGNRGVMTTIVEWSDVTTNITSLTVDFGGGTFTGLLSLSKLKAAA